MWYLLLPVSPLGASSVSGYIPTLDRPIDSPGMTGQKAEGQEAEFRTERLCECVVYVCVCVQFLIATVQVWLFAMAAWGGVLTTVIMAAWFWFKQT